MHGQPHIKFTVLQFTVLSHFPPSKANCFFLRFVDEQYELLLCKTRIKCKGKSVPLQARGPQRGSRNLRLPDYVTVPQEVGKVFSLTHRPPLPQHVTVAQDGGKVFSFTLRPPLPRYMTVAQDGGKVFQPYIPAAFTPTRDSGPGWW